MPFSGEDDLIEEFLVPYRLTDALILASGSIQGRFSVVVKERRKYPDAIFAVGKTLFVVEAKIRATELFRSTTGLSDIAFLTQVATVPAVQAAVVDRANRWIRSIGWSQEVSSVKTMAIAAIPPASGLLDHLGAVELRIIRHSQTTWVSLDD